MSICKEGLFHFGTSDFVKQKKISDGEFKFKFRFRVKRGDGDRVVIVINGERHNMAFESSDDLFDWYFFSFRFEDPDRQVRSENRMLRYYFEIRSADETLFYNRSGAHHEDTGQYDFEITPGFDTPDWSKGAVMYQIFVDRFFNGDPSNDVVTGEYAYIGGAVEHVDDWGADPKADDIRRFYGGDLKGVLCKLDYLKKLGVEVIYLNPIFVSPSNHKYDIQDYDHIDPHFGVIVDDGGDTLAAGDLDNTHATRYMHRVANLKNLEASNELFARFTDEVHRRGMRVIIDGVFNHCGSFNKWLDREKIYDGREGFERGAYADSESPYRSFFSFNEDNWPDNKSYEGWWGHDTLPKLNYEDSDTLHDYIINIGRKWVSPPYNVDGWRLDVAADLGHSEQTNHRFWKDFRAAVKEANPDAIIIAEHYGDAKPWLSGDEWDTVMNYDAFMEPVSWFLTGVEKHSDELKPYMHGADGAFKGAMSHYMSRFQTPSLLSSMNQLSNHDHSRFLTRTNGTVGRIADAGCAAAGENVNRAVMKEAIVMQMTWPGAPTLYYGDEAGVCGWTDPDNRRTYPWGGEDVVLLEFYRYAIRVHKRNRALRTGAFKMLATDHNMLSYARMEGENIIITVINNSADEKEFDIPVWQAGAADGDKMEQLLLSFGDEYNAGRIFLPVGGGNMHVKMSGFSAGIYRARKSARE